MKIIVLTLTAVTLLLPPEAIGQSANVDSSATGSTSGLSLVRTNPVGISGLEQKRVLSPIVPSAADTSCSCRRSRATQTLLGAVTGTFAGAALGAVVGTIYDANSGGEYMIPASYLLAAYGTVIGLVAGLVVGLVWPTN